MTDQLLLLPAPRHLTFGAGQFSPDEKRLIALDSLDPQEILFSARILQTALAKTGDRSWEIVAGKAAPLDQIAVELLIVPGSMPHEQGYELTVTEERIHVLAQSPAGVFYAVQTLSQLIEQLGVDLPALRCRDWPDYPNRGVMLDISRDKVPSMGTLYMLVDKFASWKINQLQLYTEHTFAYRKHPVVWAQASPMTGEQILSLDAYCRARFIELVPNQNTFGHMRPWLIHEEYRHLAECPDGSDTRWGRFDDPFSLAPSEPGSIELVRDMLNELLPHFSSPQVNVGGDEPVDLETGQGRSGEMVRELGMGRVYIDFLMKVYAQVKASGRTMQFWGDIIMEHPELVPELPRDLIALEWGYEADHPFDEHGALFAASGVPLYVCPGTSSWRTIAGRTDNAVGNLRNAARNGLKNGAVGYLITDWGDEGHWQPLPVSYLGFVYGAALSWGYQSNLNLDIRRALDLHVFKDSHGVMGSLAYDLGNVYQAIGITPHNSSLLFNILQASSEEVSGYIKHEGVDLDALLANAQHTLNQIEKIISALPDANMACEDAELIASEFSWAAEMLQHACQRMIWLIRTTRSEDASAADASAFKELLAQESTHLIEEFEEIWHARNRPGGFSDSLARLNRMRSIYLAG